MAGRFMRSLVLISVLALPSGCAWITRASVDEEGGDAAAGASNTSISADGRFVAFESRSGDLVAGDTNEEIDVFVRDVWTGTTVRASVDSDETQYSVKSIEPSISDDGHFVAFVKYNYPAGVNRIMVRDLVAGTTVDATLDPAGGPPDGDSDMPAISGDGRFVAFQTSAGDLVGSFGLTSAVARYDIQTKATVPVSTRPPQGNAVAISADGRYVAFSTYDDESQTNQLYVRDMQTGATELASANDEGSPGNAMSHSPSISADGRYVAFTSDASNLVNGDDGYADDIYVRDRATSTTERASVDSDGGNPNDRNQIPRLSADGRYVAFYTLATDMIPQTNTRDTVIVRDLATRTTMAGSSNPLEQPVTAFGYDLSGDGTYLSFSTAAGITPNDHNGFVDVFVKMLVGAHVDSISPTSISRGATRTFRVTGARFVPGTTVQAGTQSEGTEHVVIESVVVVSDTRLKVTIAVDSNAPAEPLFIFVTVPGPGPGSWLTGTTTVAPVSVTIT